MSNYQLNRHKFLLDDEHNRLKEILNKYKDSNPRDVLLIEFALRTGARASEILGLKKIYMNHQDKTIFIKANKGSNDRELPLGDSFYKRLYDYSLTVQGQLLFPITYNYFRELWFMYRPVEKKLHSLRHTFAVRLLKREKDVVLVQQALGHRSINNTMIYLNYLYSSEELKRILD